MGLDGDGYNSCGIKSLLLYRRQNSCFHRLLDEEKLFFHQEFDYIREDPMFE